MADNNICTPLDPATLTFPNFNVDGELLFNQMISAPVDSSSDEASIPIPPILSPTPRNPYVRSPFTAPKKKSSEK